MSPDVQQKGDGHDRQMQGRAGVLSSRKGRIAVLIVVAALLGNLVAGILPFPFDGMRTAFASDSALTAAQAELKAAKAQLAEEQARLDEFARKQEEAEVRLDTTRDRIAEVQAQTHKAEAKLARLQTQLSDRLVEIYKDPVTDHGKASKRGRLTLARHREHGTFKTVVLPDGAIAADAAILGPGWEDAMATVWENGKLVADQRFADIRARSEG